MVRLPARVRAFVAPCLSACVFAAVTVDAHAAPPIPTRGSIVGADPSSHGPVAVNAVGAGGGAGALGGAGGLGRPPGVNGAGTPPGGMNGETPAVGFGGALGAGERTIPPRRDEPRRFVTVTVNPLALLVARYGGNLEIVPLRHHAFIASGYLQTFPSGVLRDIIGRPELSGNTPTAVGGEFGYRYYSGREGADGLFIGPSAVIMPLAYPRVTPSTVSRLIANRSLDVDKLLDGSVELVPFYAYGAALDVGAQLVTRSGFTIGGGAGVTYIAYDVPDDVNRIPLKISVPHVLPRLLFSAGWSF